ncbi:MAG: chemotaxis response regulator protein-glutamate methylesterase [bacterium]|nr:chemotaxis response regulator protein-glutamate methylesterase [bacterium]
MTTVKKRVRVLVVDDSALVRMILTKGLALDPDIEVVGSASDPTIALQKIIQLKPNVLTLDVEMPKIDGLEFLRRLMPRYPIPVLMVSALTQGGAQITLDALAAGAIDFVTKPNVDIANGLNDMLTDLRAKVKAIANVNVSSWRRENASTTPLELIENSTLAQSTDKVIAIGASTGGTEAIRQIITRFSTATPGVVIVQHMPPGFTKMFADRLNEQCAMTVKEAADGDRVIQGRILIAPGDFQMSVIRSGGTYLVQCKKGEKVNGHCPSVEVLFNSVAQYAGANAIGVMLTGMGHDGADAMLNMSKAGARTLAQDEATSVVFGMPRVAFERGGVERLVPLPSMAQSILNLLVERKQWELSM